MYDVWTVCGYLMGGTFQAVNADPHVILKPCSHKDPETYLNDEVNAGDSRGGHHLGTVGNEVDQVR